MPRLKQIYEKEIILNLINKFNMKNKYMVPKLLKIVLNMGLGNDANDQKIMKSCVNDMSLISGQMPIITKSRKSISNFKTKKGFNAGVKVTLRKNKMYEFVDRLINIALPRIKDFKGLNPNSFDQHGNFSFGIKEHIVFPEINFDKVEKIRGFDITIVTNSNNIDQNLKLLSALNFPFLSNKKNENN